MKILSFAFITLLLLKLFGCVRPPYPSDLQSRKRGQEKRLLNENMVNSVLYVQAAAEYKALAYQAFHLARSVLDKELCKKDKDIKRAIIVDIDQTILDISPYDAFLIKKRVRFGIKRGKWLKSASAKAVPGAVEFIRYADSKGVTIFYISNRKPKYFQTTKRNLLNVGVPSFADDKLLLRESSRSKKSRRARVSQGYKVVLLIGDDLSDFHEAFDKKLSDKRNESVVKFREAFGSRFIILPNPIHGGWLKAIYENRRMKNLDEQQRMTFERKALISWL